MNIGDSLKGTVNIPLLWLFFQKFRHEVESFSLTTASLLSLFTAKFSQAKLFLNDCVLYKVHFPQTQKPLWSPASAYLHVKGILHSWMILAIVSSMVHTALAFHLVNCQIPTACMVAVLLVLSSEIPLVRVPKRWNLCTSEAKQFLLWIIVSFERWLVF